MQIQKNVSSINFGNDMVLDLGAGRREISVIFRQSVSYVLSYLVSYLVGWLNSDLIS